MFQPPQTARVPRRHGGHDFQLRGFNLSRHRLLWFALVCAARPAQWDSACSVSCSETLVVGGGGGIGWLLFRTSACPRCLPKHGLRRASFNARVAPLPGGALRVGEARQLLAHCTSTCPRISNSNAGQQKLRRAEDRSKRAECARALTSIMAGEVLFSPPCIARRWESLEGAGVGRSPG